MTHWTEALLLLAPLLLYCGVEAQNIVRVRYGYFPEARPIRVACARGWLDFSSGNTEYKVACYPQTSGNFAAARLDSAELDIADLGSTPLAQAFARGLEINVVYITDYKGDSQGIYVRPSEIDTGYGGIENPFDLVNRTLGVPFGSTMHYQVLYLLDIFGLSGQVELRNLSPTQIIEQWDDKRIDAAACWGAAREHVLREGSQDDEDQPAANVLVTAGVVGDWGRPTFGVVAANRKFMIANPEFMYHFVAVFAQLTDSFIDRLGEDDSNNVARWIPDTNGASSFMPSLADSIMKAGEPKGNPSTDFINQQRRALNLYKQQSTSEQLSCDYLMGNGGRSCGKPSLQHEAIQQTARFLMEQKVIHSMGQLEIMGNATGCSITSTLCGSNLFAGNILKTANQRYSSTSLLDSSSSVFPLYEIGRPGANQISTGDSTCIEGRDIYYGSGTQEFGDGANAVAGKSYSDNLQCLWRIYKYTDCQLTQTCNEAVFVVFRDVKVWSGDYIRVYSDPTYLCNPDGPKVLLAQITGLQPNLPVLRGSGCILVEFVTDSNEERSYGDSDNAGDGFVAQVGGSSSCGNCNGFPCDDKGLCECDGVHWGSDCSFTDHCLGTSHIVLTSYEQIERIANSYAVRDGIASSSTLYPNDLDCPFEVQAAQREGFVIFDVEYDLETTFDMLELYSGSFESESGVTLYTALTGTSESIERYYIPADSEGFITIRLVTDSRGRRAGFSGTVSTDFRYDSPTSCDLGESGLFCEIPHCIAQNSLARDMGSSSHLNRFYHIGRVVSTSRESRGLPVSSTCTWSLSEVPPPADTSELRLVFNKPLDLEPHFPSAVGDKLVIQSDNGSVEIFAEKCSSNDDCGGAYDWQTGICDQDSGACILKSAFNISGIDYATAKAVLVTDRNDEDQNFGGVDFDALFVKSCPTEEGRQHCEMEDDGQCVDGVCICEGGIPCSCPCDGGGLVSELDGGLIAGIAIGLLLLFAGIFFWYRRRKIRHSRAQKAIIAEKDEELEAFRNSVVGMRTASTHYMPKPASARESAIVKDDSVQVIAPSMPLVPKVQWCWRETSHMMTNHAADMIVGNPSDCWVKYDAYQNKELEAAFQIYSKSGNSSKLRHCYPMPGYQLDFRDMIQTKQQTGFQREVQRLVEVSQPAPHREKKEIDFGEVDVGDALPEDISSEPQMVLVKGDVIQISSQRQDGWAFGTKLHHNDEEVARELVRISSKNSTEDEANIFTDTGWFPLDLTEIPTGEELTLLQTKVGDSGSLDPPPYWDPIADPSVVQRHRLPKQNDERHALIKAFKSTLHPPKFNKKVKIVNVERIQNLGMWQSYVVKRQTICYRESGPNASAQVQQKAIERFERHWLWHGTNVEVMDKIMQQGFNRSFCGKNATVYGKGVYFARDASYSAWPTYSVPDKKGHQYMMACRVIVGEYCPGVHNGLTPDIRDPVTHTLYDSTVGLLTADTLSNPSIYVTYHDAQAYPEYLIEFKLE